MEVVDGGAGALRGGEVGVRVGVAARLEAGRRGLIGRCARRSGARVVGRRRRALAVPRLPRRRARSRRPTRAAAAPGAPRRRSARRRAGPRRINAADRSTRATGWSARGDARWLRRCAQLRGAAPRRAARAGARRGRLRSGGVTKSPPAASGERPISARASAGSAVRIMQSGGQSGPARAGPLARHRAHARAELRGSLRAGQGAARLRLPRHATLQERAPLRDLARRGSGGLAVLLERERRLFAAEDHALGDLALLDRPRDTARRTGYRASPAP